MSLPPQETSYQEAHIGDNRQIDIIVATAIGLPAAYLTVALRFSARRSLESELCMDDWTILVGLVRRHSA